MRVLLIHPPDNKNCIAPGRFEPLALEILAATIPDHEVRILDLRFDAITALERQLDSFHPEIAGVTVNNTIHVRQAIGILEKIRSNHPDIKLITGGHHPTMVPLDFHLSCVDYIFLGWAEESFPEFIRCMEQKCSIDHIEGLEILANAEVVGRRENPWKLQPSGIPFPRRDLVSRYRNRYRSDMGFRTALVNTTRGCGNRCTFCSVWKAANGHFLVRRPEDIFNEIASLPDDINRVFFADDNTFIRTDNAARLCRMIMNAGIRKKYSGYCRSDTIVHHPELMREWKNIGLDNLCVGMEATDNSLLQKFNKKNEISNNEDAAKILNDTGITFRPHFLIDPSFDLADFRRTGDYIRKLRLNSPIFPILTPIPGSVYHEEVKDRIFLDYDYFDYAHAVIPTNLSPRVFYKAWRRLFQRSYPLLRNLMLFLRKHYAQLMGNKKLEMESCNYSLLNLLILKVLSVFLTLKLKKHVRLLEAGLIQL